jgi:large subunit ribosomal protein L17
MLRNLAASVILFEKVETTEAKGKEIKRMIDRTITIAKKNTLAARRQLLGLYFDKNVVDKLFDVLVARFADRPSGYTRVLRLGNRVGDNASKVVVMFVEGVTAEAKAEKPAAKRATKKTEEVEVATEDKQEKESSDDKAE